MSKRSVGRREFVIGATASGTVPMFEKDCPNCDKVCQDVVAFWSSAMLLGKKEDM